MLAMIGLLMLFCLFSTSAAIDFVEYMSSIEKTATFCQDRAKIYPACKVCVPGAELASDGTCSSFVPQSARIRNEIERLTKNHHPPDPAVEKLHARFGLYPYLELPEFLERQKVFGKMIGEAAPTDILDIGAYFNPISMFFDMPTACPASMVVVEPILNALSAYVPCTPGNRYSHTHLMILPITFKQYIQLEIRHPTAVVCIGCDSIYGPNRRMLVHSFPRPFTLYLEFAAGYHHNRPFLSMYGDGPGEAMVYKDELHTSNKHTNFTERAMRVIKYT